MAPPPPPPSGAPPPGALPPIPPNIAEITGPLMFGLLFTWGLFGVLTVQVYIYYLCFPKDKRSFKVLIYGVYLLDVMQTAMTGADAWYWFCKGYGNLIMLSNPYVSAYDTPMLGSAIALIVQWFFCYRIWTLSRSWLLASFIAVISLLGSAAGFLSGIRGAIVGNFAAARAEIDLVALYIWLIGSAAADALIAGSLTFLLMRSRSTQHKQSSDILYRIVRLTVETNIASASIAMISLILYFASPNTSFFITPTFFLGKIYANTLLVTFNNRVLLAKSTQNNQTSVGTTSTLTNARPTVTGYRYSPGGTAIPQTVNISDTPRSGETFKMETYNDIEPSPPPSRGTTRGPDARFGGYPAPPRPGDLYRGA